MASFPTSQAISHSQSHHNIYSYIKQTTITFHSHKTSNKKMENIIQHLQENTDNENEYYISDDQDDYFESYDQDADAVNSNTTHIVNAILSGAARLNVLLPTATTLNFAVSAPLLTNNSKCTTTLDRWLIGTFVSLLATCCIFFSITDRFRTADGRLYYGVATFHGIRTFGGGRACRPCVPLEYRLGWGDLFRSSLSLVFFLAFALVHDSVLGCYHVILPGKIVNLGPLVVGVVISFLFVLFPSTRRGMGYPFMLHSDGLHIRY